MKFGFGLLICFIFVTGCASEWKIQGGPKSCINMCKEWGLEFTAMVGVGSQDSIGPGATACVCQPKRKDNTVSLDGASGSSASLSAPITVNAAAAAQAAQMLQAQQRNAYSSSSTGYHAY